MLTFAVDPPTGQRIARVEMRLTVPPFRRHYDVYEIWAAGLVVGPGGSLAVIEGEFFEMVDPILVSLGLRQEPGEEFRAPPLDIPRYYRRPVRLHWLPILGRAQSVVAAVRQPVDVGVAGSPVDYRAFLARLAMAVNGRFPPGRRAGWGSIGLTAVVLTPEPIAAEDDAHLAAALKAPGRSRVVALGLIRLNLGQEAMSFHLAGGPDDLFPEPIALADALTARFRRFVPLFDGT